LGEEEDVCGGGACGEVGEEVDPDVVPGEEA
jgi:hypothetical protein